MEDRWLTVDDICKYLNVSNETVYKWIDQRKMPGHRVGRRWMFKQDEVDEWVRSGGAADRTSESDSANKKEMEVQWVQRRKPGQQRENFKQYWKLHP